MNLKPSRTTCTERDLKILKHVAEFHLTTAEALLVLFFQGKRIDAVKSTLRRLGTSKSGKGLLQSEPLDSQRVYYRLTSRAVRLLGVSRDRARPLGRQAVCKRYALLWFICLQRPGKRLLFQPQDYPELFSLGHSRFPRHYFYFDQRSRGPLRIGFVIIDHGAHPQRLLRKLREKALLFLNHTCFTDFILSHSLEMTLLTLSPEKQESLERLIAQKLLPELQRKRIPHSGRPHPFTFPVQIETVPGLLPLIGAHLR